MRPVALAGILASTTMLGGCAGTIGGITFSSISSFAGFASTIFTGADLGEHAASLVTGKDCRFSEGLMRADRDVCEVPGSLATRDDFHGIFVERIDEDGTVIFAAPKYMPASVGAGENENDTDVIWAQIKAQKVTEENERQLARANNATQSIDVAALATGSLTSDSLAFLPAVTAEITDGDTASQTASAPVRPVFNAATSTPKKAAAKETLASVDIPMDQPAIDEGALTAPLKAARENGQGGPLFTTAASASSAPVASTLVNGEPVVVLRLSFGGVQPPIDTASMAPIEAVHDESSTVVALPAASVSSSAPSPLALLNQTAPQPPEVLSAAVEPPPMPQSRSRAKPAPAEISKPAPEISETVVEEMAAVEKPKPARRKREVEAQPVVAAPQPDVYSPPSVVASSTPDLIAAPGDIPTSSSMPAPAATAPVATYLPSTPPSEPAAPATSGPAPLYPIAQP